MSSPAPDHIRFPFLTQRPTEDGCGAYVLQMLTGKSYAEIAGIIGWREGELRRSSWDDIARVLSALGYTIGTPQPASDWSEVRGVAIVHVKDDHFMFYDADNKVFYDPWEWEGPSTQSARVPLSYLEIPLPA